MAKALVVDDDAGLRGVTGLLLKRAGFEVVLAADGVQAIRALERGGIAILVTDILLPEKDGIETITETRRRWPRCPIVAMSGGGPYETADLLDVAMRVGADAIVAKPFNANIMLGAVAKALNARRAGPLDRQAS